jgi:hypothetical protein
MPTATAPGFLVDGYGRPATYYGTGNLHRPSRADEALRERPASLFADYLTLLSAYRYRELTNRCRTLATRGLVAAILEQRADYVAGSHFAPVFEGADEKWGSTAHTALLEALAMCNLRGPRFDWRTTWRLSSITRATDGSWFILLTEWPDSGGLPALQCFEGHRIGQRDPEAGTVGPTDALTILTDGSVRRGVYRGLKIDQGIIYNPAGQEVAYRVLGPATDGSEDQDISARDMIHVARPRRYSEGRPLPDLAAAAMDFTALDMAQTAQLDQQIIDARQTVIESNASGKAPDYAPGAGFGQSGRPAEPTEVYERGGTKFIKSGFDAKPWQTQRPSDQWMNFDWRVGARAAAAIRWRLEMLDPSHLGGAANRAFQDQINTAIADEFAIDAPAAIRVVRYFTAKLIQARILPEHPEARAWGIAPPPWFEVDRNSARIDLEEVAAGRVSMSRLHQRDGQRTIDVLRSRAHLYKLAQQVHAEDTTVPFEIILGDLGRTTARTGAPTASPTSPASSPSSP